MRGHFNLYVAIILLPALSISQFTVDGYAYLEDQSNHSGIEVLFERTVPSSLTETTNTDANGYYTIEIPAGFYDITYSHYGFDSQVLFEQFFSDDATIADIILPIHIDDNAPTVGDIPDQTINEGQSFITFDLDNYLTELDGDEVEWSFEIVDGTVGPTAQFINQINYKKVQFMDLSAEGSGNIVSWNWDFGDGNSSTEQHPLHLYAEVDTYNVLLEVSDENNLSDSITKEIIIPDTAIAPIVDFSYFQSNTFGVDSLEITFTDESEEGDGNITSWVWVFGDGNSSTEQNPVHLYTPDSEPDDPYQVDYYYTVTLIVTDEFGFSYTFVNDSIRVNNPNLPTVNFVFEINILEVTCTAYTTSDGEIISYHWDFGDTTTVADTSDLQSPTYTYPAPGIYSVSLTVIDSYGLSAGDTTDIAIYPSEDPPSANFSWATDLLQVTFTDLSVAGDTTITNWSWDFGDGNTSTEQSPVYTYFGAGTYSVSLTATDANGLSDISTQNVTVTSELVGPTANFTHSDSYLIIQFTDASQAGDGIINNWSWNFGDGNTSTEQNPVHEYATADTFIVSLTVMDANNLTDTYSDSVISVEYLQTGPSADFEYSVNNYTVTFTDFSSEGSDAITGWNWDFGDGSASTEQNPEHTYSPEGIYNVNLTVTDANSLSDSHSEQVVLGIYFTASVNASGGGDEYDLTFGFSPLSTDGFDASHCLDSQGNTLPAYTTRTTCLSGPNDSGEFGECPSCGTPAPPNLSSCEDNGCTWVSIHTWVEGDAYAPSAPPPPAFDAALDWDNDRYYTQILAGLYSDVGVEHVYDIALGYPGDNLITITWDNTGWSDLGYFFLQDAFGGVMINVDMTIETSLELTSPAFNLLKLKVTPSGSSGRTQSRDLSVDIDENNVVTITYPPGWTGSEEIIFTATDQTVAGLSDSDNAVFTVISDSLSQFVQIPDQIVYHGEVLEIQLEDYGFGEDDLPIEVNVGWLYGESPLISANINDLTLVIETADSLLNIPFIWQYPFHTVTILGQSFYTSIYPKKPSEDHLILLGEYPIYSNGVYFSQPLLSPPLESHTVYYLKVSGNIEVNTPLPYYCTSTYVCSTYTEAGNWSYLPNEQLNENGIDDGGLSPENGSPIFTDFMLNVWENADSSYIGRPYKDGIKNSVRSAEYGSPVITQEMIDEAANDPVFHRYYVPETDIILWNVTEDVLGFYYSDGIDNDFNGAIDDGIDLGIDDVNERWFDGIDNDGDDDVDEEDETGTRWLMRVPPWAWARNLGSGFGWPYGPLLASHFLTLQYPEQVEQNVFELFYFYNAEIFPTEGDGIDSSDTQLIFSVGYPACHDGIDNDDDDEIDEEDECDLYSSPPGDFEVFEVNITVQLYAISDTSLSIGTDINTVPSKFTLHQNYPNPFNPITSLRYDLPEQAQVTLTVFDLMGREVTQLVNTTQEAGYRSVQWNATDMQGKPVSAGVYLYHIQAGEFVQTRKMVLLK